MSRLIWADRLKGCLIILVVLGHAIQQVLGAASEDNHLWNLIYSFHMPAFVAVSGYLGFRSKRVAVSRRFRQLIVPFLLWSLVLFLVHPPYRLGTLANFVWRPDSTFWFLWVLFWITWLFWGGDWLAKRLRVKQEVLVGVICLALVLMMALGNVRVLGLQFISYYFLFYVMGYYLHKYEGLRTSSPALLLLLTAVWAVLAWFWKMHAAPTFLAGIGLPMSIMNYGYRFLTAFVAVYVILCAAPLLLNYRQGYDNLLLFCGVWSLGIYVLQAFLLPPICSFFGRYLTAIPLIVLAFTLALAGSLGLVWLLSLNRFTAKYLLGKLDRHIR